MSHFRETSPGTYELQRHPCWMEMPTVTLTDDGYVVLGGCWPASGLSTSEVVELRRILGQVVDLDAVAGVQR